MNDILYFIDFLLLLLSEINNTTILLMVLLNAIDGKVDDCCTWQCCCICSWQLTMGPHGLSLWLGAVNVVLRHGSLVTHVEDKKIGWCCHIAGQQQLGAQRGLHKISSGANHAPESLCTVCATGTLTSGCTGHCCPYPSH
jgi:hypothetical protein